MSTYGWFSGGSGGNEGSGGKVDGAVEGTVAVLVYELTRCDIVVSGFGF